MSSETANQAIQMSFAVDKDGKRLEVVDAKAREDIDKISKEIAEFVGSPVTDTGKRIIAPMLAGDVIAIKTTAQTVTRMGKNLFEVGSEAADYVKKSGWQSADREAQTIKTYVMAGNECFGVRDVKIPAQAGDTFVISAECISHDANVVRPVLKLLDADGNILTTGCSGTYSAYYTGFTGGGYPKYVYQITNENVAFVQPGYYMKANGGVANGDTVVFRIQCEIGEEETEWIPGSIKTQHVTNGEATLTAVEGVNTVFSQEGADVTVTWRSPGITLSVNGKVGHVVLTAEDVGAMPADYTPPVNILTRNADMHPTVQAAARYGHNGQGAFNTAKQLTILAMTDLHHDLTRFMSAIEYINGTPEIDFGISLGDMQGEHFTDNDGTWFNSGILSCQKKVYPVIGNHDAGNSNSTDKAGTKSEQFAKFFRETGLEKNGLTGLTTTYYSVNTEYGVTMIVLDCHDVPDTMIDETTFAVGRGVLGYSQAQIDWLIDTLNAVPAENHVIIAVHNTFDPATMIDGPWTQEGHINGDDPTGYNYPDMIPEIVDAWQYGKALSKSYTPQVNTTTMPTLTVNADFTTRGEGVFAGYLRGHAHKDYIAKMTNYPTQNIYYSSLADSGQGSLIFLNGLLCSATIHIGHCEKKK